VVWRCQSSFLSGTLYLRADIDKDLAHDEYDEVCSWLVKVIICSILSESKPNGKQECTQSLISGQTKRSILADTNISV
jgi:hypothetical protein